MTLEETPQRRSLWREWRKPVAVSLVAVAALVVLVSLMVKSLANISGSYAPITIPFDTSLSLGSDDLPIDEAPLARRAGEFEPDQIHIGIAGARV